jgi:hypothetical protein
VSGAGEAPAEQVRALMAKGFAVTVFPATEDCQASFEALRARGVEFVEEHRRRLRPA